MSADPLIAWTDEPLNAETPLHALCRSHVTPTELFFVRSHGPVPAVDPTGYRLALVGEVREPLALSLTDLRERFPATTLAATLACAGNRRRELGEWTGVPWGPGAIGNARWTGVRLRDVLLAAGIDPDARHVAFTGLDEAEADGRTEPFGGSIPVEKALAPEVLLAYEMNGEPLPPEHGFPVRAVVPGYIGARSVKWLSEISVRDSPSPSFFHARDYTLGGEPLGEQRVNSAVCRPRDGETVRGPVVAVEGYAIARGGRRLEQVELSPDGGTTWLAVELEPEPADAWTWRLWRTQVDLGPGSHELVARAWDGSAGPQPERPTTASNPRGYMNNGWHRVHLTVTG